MDRRAFLKRTLPAIGGAALLLGDLASGSASAQEARAENEDPNLFVMPRLRFRTLNPVTDQWDVRPTADEFLLQYLKDNTNVKVSEKPWSDRVVDITTLGDAYRNPTSETAVFSRPFLFMTGEGDFRLEEDEARTFQEYFQRGGFLYADDCVSQSRGRVGDGGDFFYRAFVREMKRVFPDGPMQAVPFEHEIYHCFFDFANGAPRCQGQIRPDMGLFLEDRLAAFVTAGDLHCGWFRGRSIPPQKHEESYRMGVNIVIYALTH